MGKSSFFKNAELAELDADILETRRKSFLKNQFSTQNRLFSKSWHTRSKRFSSKKEVKKFFSITKSSHAVRLDGDKQEKGSLKTLRNLFSTEK